jgi:hypothetical protein
MMERDRRLTGSLRGQSVRLSIATWQTSVADSLTLIQTEPVAPAEFATNSVWKTGALN